MDDFISLQIAVLSGLYAFDMVMGRPQGRPQNITRVVAVLALFISFWSIAHFTVRAKDKQEALDNILHERRGRQILEDEYAKRYPEPTP